MSGDPSDYLAAHLQEALALRFFEGLEAVVNLRPGGGPLSGHELRAHGVPDGRDG